MVIEKHDKTYTVNENKLSWTVRSADGRITVSTNVPKESCPTFDDLKAFVAESNLF